MFFGLWHENMVSINICTTSLLFNINCNFCCSFLSSTAYNDFSGWSQHWVEGKEESLSKSNVFLERFYKNMASLNTRTNFPLIQCWLQVWLLIPGRHCPVTFQAGHNIDSRVGERRVSLSKSGNFWNFFTNIWRVSIIFVTDCR